MPELLLKVCEEICEVSAVFLNISEGKKSEVQI